MSESGTPSDRLEDIRRRIDQARDRLELHDMLHKDHRATADDLMSRYRHLQNTLADETASVEAKGGHVDSFEKTVLTWINGLTFDR